MTLKDRVAIISGAGRGIGKASALEMSREGASVVILSRSASELKAVEEEIHSHGMDVMSLVADVSKSADITKTVGRTISRFGRIDILMNNAAVTGPVKKLHMITQREWTETMNIDLRSVFLFSKAVIPHMIKQSKGKIINLSSGLGEMVMSPFGAYSVAKAGVIHLTKIMAEELKDHNIQVNGLDPGVVDTRMHEDIRKLGPSVLGETVYAEFKALKDRDYLSSPQEAARLAVFLASDASDMISGQVGTEGLYAQLGFKG